MVCIYAMAYICVIKVINHNQKLIKMTTQFKIAATAPTSYQYNSLSRFGMTIKKNGNGSFSSEQVFDSEEEAKAYLVERAERYYDEFEGQVDEHLQDIEKYGMLTIDAVTARIDEVENEEEVED